MPRRSLDKGRRSERDVVRKLNAWAGSTWRFSRRGLGHAGVADVVAVGSPPWPFVVSIKAGRGPTLRTLLERAGAAARWPWWDELMRAPGQEPERAWLVWKSDGTWLLSCARLWGLAAPPRVTLLPEVPWWPRYTMLLDAFLARVGPDIIARVAEPLVFDAVVAREESSTTEEALRRFVDRGRRAQAAVDRLTGGR